MPQNQDEEVLILKPPGEETTESESEEQIVSLESIQDPNLLIGDEIPEPIEVKKSPKKLYIIIAVVVLVIIILLIVLIFLLKKDKGNEIDATGLAQKIESNYKTQDFAASRIDDMIAKANRLYEKGNKFEALKIYENIATYNQSLSNYNLGVSQMKQGNCEQAVISFNKAIQDRENTTVSAINAAVCSLETNSTQNFNYYIGLANSFLQNEVNSPLYSYYHALINYYKGNYYEALQSLKHPSSEHYKDKYVYLSAKISSILKDDQVAIDKLESQKDFNANITLAQLYANEANYDKARDYLNKAARNTTNPDLIKMIAAIIDLKTGFYKDGARFIRDVYTADPLKPSQIFKIKATLNPEIFDVNLAQMSFSDEIFFNKARRYETLFYFAPYKVFDVKQSIEYIRKGGVSVFLDDTSTANDFLSKSATVSKVNIELSGVIAKALNYRLKEANRDFIELAKLYPQHSILQYNLALSYAQLGNFSLAAKHFASSYHLDPNNHLAGIFAAFSYDMTQSLDPKFIGEITENLESDKNLKQNNLYTSLLNLINSNQSAMMRWLEEPKEQTMFNVAFDAIISKIVGRDDVMQQKTDILVSLLPNDIMTNILNFIAYNKQENIKEYAQKIQIYFKTKKLDVEAFYHGANIIRKQYIKLLQISGLLSHEREKIKEQLRSAPENVNIMQTLAYIELFSNDFEESFRLYNKIIDEYNIQDASTLFLASVAATGANQPQNAIALLELTKLTDPNAIENRVALGYLYHQIDNINAALIQYDKIGNTDHKNEFYDFMIDNEK
ncbi:tetratricopeptide repeat protein [Campylobacter sp. RM9344]|uniref:Tetratricopeptide repeat protein n=1 Tax=Campylobacter californiensis TaxID=1032243 RepID=A0AAW3ZXB9_9BACT|nr:MULTISPECIES: tetratricopeptide repeat protein [unclassified Campylobacter]MBE2985256.1 tetratricopeptide repeat protein [Campylobacter sp. RM6883]MBE2995658.1 tetratricopeptide repeat protein [Campylobacter sp. RM6913]MBE3029723.1 tetratricopeptide repeat protein [Campylobacter sp. RM9344]MBE3608653.1 tetratricopeptide repeat protein [Campylobacter sp. RM9337]QCD51324.1 paralysed flagella protein B [Campylobacter sp. RM6914]